MLEDVIEKMAFSIFCSSCGNLPFIILISIAKQYSTIVTCWENESVSKMILMEPFSGE
jgi:hypothetical protein